ncbi:hypothetical protein BJ546DRAFT_574406 [Cryomyces antarcticus]
MRRAQSPLPTLSELPAHHAAAGAGLVVACEHTTLTLMSWKDVSFSMGRWTAPPPPPLLFVFIRSSLFAIAATSSPSLLLQPSNPYSRFLFFFCFFFFFFFSFLWNSLATIITSTCPSPSDPSKYPSPTTPSQSSSPTLPGAPDTSRSMATNSPARLTPSPKSSAKPSPITPSTITPPSLNCLNSSTAARSTPASATTLLAKVASISSTQGRTTPATSPLPSPRLRSAADGVVGARGGMAVMDGIDGRASGYFSFPDYERVRRECERSEREECKGTSGQREVRA